MYGGRASSCHRLQQMAIRMVAPTGKFMHLRTTGVMDSSTYLVSSRYREATLTDQRRAGEGQASVARVAPWQA